MELLVERHGRFAFASRELPVLLSGERLQGQEVLPSYESDFSESSTVSTPDTRSLPSPPPSPGRAESSLPAVEADAVVPVPLSARSSRSNWSVSTEVVAQHGHLERPQEDVEDMEDNPPKPRPPNQPSDVAELKRSLKAFVQAMVRGKDVQSHEDGTLKATSCKLSKKVDAIVLEPRVIPLVEIAHVHRGMEALPLALQIELSPSWVVLDAWFLETMYRGRDYYILSDSALLEVECAITRSRDIFRLRWDSKKERKIHIQQIVQMRSFKVGGATPDSCHDMALGSSGLVIWPSIFSLHGGGSYLTLYIYIIYLRFWLPAKPERSHSFDRGCNRVD
eukprot:Skav220708  [mRNA]  locus=scaffold1850:8050:10714:- [translate_table: standard]